MTGRPQRPTTARAAAARSLSRAAERFPDLPAVTLEVSGLAPKDAALATAIHRTVLQRWITLEYLLNRVLANKPLQTLESAMQAVLMTGAAQLLFMQRLPTHAVVDEQVKLAKQMIRPGAGGLVNAVLRKVAAMVGEVLADESWQPAVDRLPLEGGCVQLAEPLLPDVNQAVRHLAVATSHPRALINRWVSAFGMDKAQALCVHGVQTPPVIVAVEPGFVPESDEDYQSHQAPGFVVWLGDNRALRRFIAQHPARRVQDPASALAVNSTRDLMVRRALDFCAGRGTKTCQLAVMHPDALIAATDVDSTRRSSLSQAADAYKNVKVVGSESEPDEPIDLLLLDVPCSNTAVLGRRPEARYRFDSRSLASLVKLQRQIIRRTSGWVRPGGAILYSTCSLEREENQEQVRWAAGRVNGRIAHEHQAMPAGRGTTHQDGGYHALIHTQS